MKRPLRRLRLLLVRREGAELADLAGAQDADQMDGVVASVHSHFNQEPEQMTARLLKAIENPNTCLIGHATGRLLLRRNAYKLDMGAILKAAATAEARGWKAWQDKSGWYLDQLKAKGMKVQAPSDVLATGFKKVGEQLTQDWLKKAGTDGQAIVEAYKKM